MNAYADKVYATEIALDVSTSDAQAIVDAQDATIATLRAERDALRNALKDLVNPRYAEALYNGEHWAMQAVTVARAALARCKS